MSHRETIPESKAISGWLFLSGSRRMWQDPYDLVVAGGVYRMEPVGFHWYGLEPSEGAIDAVLNARGPICCRVSAWGEVLRGRDRFVAGSVRVEWIEDASAVLWSFAGDGADEDPIVAASRAIRSAMPARPNKQEEKTGKARDRLNERLAGMLEGLRRTTCERTYAGA